MKQFCIFFIVWVLPIFNISIVAQNNYYYYLEEKIDDSGVVPIKRKSKFDGNYNPRGITDYLRRGEGHPTNVGDYFSHEDVVYDNTNIGDVFREVQKGRTIEDLRDEIKAVGDTKKLRLLLFFFHIAISALIALLGKNRDIGYGWSFAACFFLFPIIGLTIILCSKRKIEFIDIKRD